jgi:hypothetical protein
MQLKTGRDVYSGYGSAVGLKNKQTDTIMNACVSIKIMLESYGHRLGMLLFDSEPVFKSIRQKSILGDVRVEYTPPGLHNKRAERFIREVKEKSNAIRAGLSYDLPKKLQFELYAFTVDTIKIVPNTQTGKYTTPFQLMTRKRPVIGTHKFGQVGYMYMKRPELDVLRAEFGIYVGYDLNNPHNMCIYSVQRDTMYMMNEFVPQP